MKKNHVLIDYENVQPAVAKALVQPVFKVWVFVGAQQAKVKFDLVDLVQSKGEDARVVRIGSNGRNALDFHIAYYLGTLAKEFPEDYFHIIGNDTGLDPLLAHLRERGLNASRWADVFDIPIVKAPAATADDDKLSRIVEYLVRRGNQRPATWKTLVGSAASLFQPKLDDHATVALLEQLKENGVFEIDGSKVRYGLPD